MCFLDDVYWFRTLKHRFDGSIILLLLECLLGSLLTEADKTSVVPGCLQAAAHIGGLLLGSDLATLLLHRCGHMGHGLAGKRLLDSGGLVSGSILHPSILDLLGTTWEDNQVSLVLAEALDISLQPLNRAVATAVVHSDAQGLCLELANLSRLDLGEREPTASTDLTVVPWTTGRTAPEIGRGEMR